MNTAISNIAMGSASHHPKLKEQLKRYNISFQEIKDGNAVIIQIKARTLKGNNRKDTFFS